MDNGNLNKLIGSIDAKVSGLVESQKETNKQLLRLHERIDKTDDKLNEHEKREVETTVLLKELITKVTEMREETKKNTKLRILVYGGVTLLNAPFAIYLMKEWLTK